MDRLAAVCEDIARHASRLEKTRILADYLKTLGDSELQLAVGFLSSGPKPPQGLNHTLFAVEEAPKLSIGYSVLREALQKATGWDRETLSVCHTQVGDTGETIALLLHGRSSDEAMSLQAADELYGRLFAARTTVEKRNALEEAFCRYRPATIKYFVKIITRNLRIGLLERMVEEAVALAAGVELQAVRDAMNRLGDLATIALAAREGRLAGIEARLFHPMDFMLAKPLDRVEDLPDPEEWLIEDKFDGIRAQIHFENGHVRIFSRGLEDVSAAFPEVVADFKRLGGSGLIDGELIAWRDGRVLSFNLLQQRIARKRVRASLQQEIPVVFVSYDLLLRDGRVLFGAAIEERRALLHEVVGDRMVSRESAAATHAEIEELFASARARGNEGLVLKRKGSAYEAGRRGGAWLKMKRPYGTLDVVVTSAEPGQGRRAIFLSDYTFAVRAGNQFLNVGKAYSGLTDSEVKELTRLLRSASTDKFGRVFLVKPEVVLEVAFDGVQKSPRHKSGYALRFPRILRWRRDKKPEECDELARVEQLFNESLR